MPPSTTAGTSRTRRSNAQPPLGGGRDPRWFHGGGRARRVGAGGARQPGRGFPGDAHQARVTVDAGRHARRGHPDRHHRRLAGPALALTPSCFQPATAATLPSDTFKPGSPRATPQPSARATPTPAPAPVTYPIYVDGVNFNPYSAVLVTFDAGPGGTPQSFERTTDVFGRFNFDIQVRSRSEGVHLVRADDFRQREADATYKIPCFQPSVALNPPICPPGFVTSVVGRGFPPRTTIQFLNWGTPALRSPWPKNIKTDESGSFQYSILVLYHALLGPRMLQAIVANPFGDRAGSAIEADAPFLVTPGRAQPNDLVLRR